MFLRSHNRDFKRDKYRLSIRPDKYTAYGRYFGYPACCVSWFTQDYVPVVRGYNKITPGRRLRLLEHSKNSDSLYGQKPHAGFIPCPACATKLRRNKGKGQTDVSTLVTNRQCPFPFPQDEPVFYALAFP